MVMRQGGATKRPGTEFIGPIRDITKRARLIPFVFNVHDALVLEFGPLTVRFIQNGAFIADPIDPTAIYEILSPYTEAELPELQYVQSADVVTIVHPSHPPYELQRFANNHWTLTPITFGAAIAKPTGVVATPTDFHGGRDCTYVVTAVSDTGEESLASDPTTAHATPLADLPNDLAGTAAGATTYNVYRSDFGASVYGFIGSGVGSTIDFADRGQLPDYTIQPPVEKLPFAATGDYPSVVAYYQQRLVFANTNNKPDTVWCSRTGHFHNFNVSVIVQDDDAITFRLISDEVDAVRHIITVGRMIVGTEGAAWIIEGDGSGALTPITINPRAASYDGMSSLRPIKIGSRILFVQALGSAVRELLANVQFGSYSFAGGDVTIYSSHLVDGYQLVDWAHQQEPTRVVWAVRSDGVLLGLTYIPEQETLAWHRHDTKGFIENVCVVPEGKTHWVYWCVKRLINGSYRRYIERQTVSAVVPVFSTIDEIAATPGGIPVPPPPPPPPDTHPASITVTPTSVTLLPEGGTRQLVAVVKNAAGTVLTGFAPTWSASAPGVVFVGNAGLVTGISAGGPVDVTASLTIDGVTITSNPCTFTVVATAGGGTGSATLPELPREEMDTSYPTETGLQYLVHAGDDLQAVINTAAAAGSGTIIIDNGATFSGNYILPPHTGTSVIIIRPAILGVPARTKMTSFISLGANLPKIVTPNVDPAIHVADRDGTGYWRLVGLEVFGTPQGAGVDFCYKLVQLGDGFDTTTDELPQHVVIDRCDIHGGLVSVQHGVVLNGRNLAVIDSSIGDIHWPGVESHAIAGWAGAGPYHIENNDLDAASSNVIFGGADSLISGLIQSDITVRRNHVFKRLSYKTAAGYATKNLLESKCAKRLLIEGNVFENSWPGGGQKGQAFMLWSATDRPDLAPWTETADVTVRYNRITHCSLGATLDATGNNGSGVPMSRVAFLHNVFEHIGSDAYSFLFELLNALTDITIHHNTGLRSTTDYGAPIIMTGTGATGLSIKNNILATATPYSFLFKDGGLLGPDALNDYAGTDGWECEGNVIAADVRPDKLPTNNLLAATTADLRFVDLDGGNYRLASDSPYNDLATDNTDPGADIDTVDAAIAGVV